LIVWLRLLMSVTPITEPSPVVIVEGPPTGIDFTVPDYQAVTESAATLTDSERT
jgi:hypothetical protein